MTRLEAELATPRTAGDALRSPLSIPVVLAAPVAIPDQRQQSCQGAERRHADRHASEVPSDLACGPMGELDALKQSDWGDRGDEKDRKAARHPVRFAVVRRLAENGRQKQREPDNKRGGDYEFGEQESDYELGQVDCATSHAWPDGEHAD